MRTTMDLGVQTAARRALAAEERPAAIVAISASTGGIIAVVQNDAADALGPVSLTGLYPPGSTFKTETTADQSPEPINPATVRALRAMMEETVNFGTATSLNDIAGLGGKTGTAEVGGGQPSHGWFAGIKGDLAFSTFVAGADSSSPAVEATGRFLRDGVMSEWR